MAEHERKPLGRQQYRKEIAGKPDEAEQLLAEFAWREQSREYQEDMAQEFLPILVGLNEKWAERGLSLSSFKAIFALDSGARLPGLVLQKALDVATHGSKPNLFFIPGSQWPRSEKPEKWIAAEQLIAEVIHRYSILRKHAVIALDDEVSSGRQLRTVMELLEPEVEFVAGVFMNAYPLSQRPIAKELFIGERAQNIIAGNTSPGRWADYRAPYHYDREYMVRGVENKSSQITVSAKDKALMGMQRSILSKVGTLAGEMFLHNLG